MVLKPLLQKHAFRPQLADIKDFIENDPSPKAIFLNSPHNPTGGVTTESDLRQIADLIRGRNIAVLSDEPYCHMVWNGQHHSLAAQPDMLQQCVAAYTFSKSYSMSGWRLGFCVSSPEIVESISLMLNTSVSCTPPLVQMAGIAALERDGEERDGSRHLVHRTGSRGTDPARRIHWDQNDLSWAGDFQTATWRQARETVYDV